MALAYIPPGVNVEELTSPSVSPILATNAQVCLVGLARGYQVGTTQVVFPPGVAPQTITAPLGGAFVRVSGTQVFESATNLTDPRAGAGGEGTYTEGAAADTADADFFTTVAAGGATATVTPIVDSSLDTDGGTVVFTYRYLPENYYSATRIDGMAVAESRFGPAFDEAGIVTPLTAAASIAFQNGASDVVIAPLFKLTDGANPLSVRIQPTDAEAAASAQWDATFFGLRDIEDINVLVPVAGQSFISFNDTAVRDVFFSAQAHVHYMAGEGQLMVLVAGEDSAGNVANATATTLRDHAGQLRDRFGGARAEQTVLISPSRFRRQLPSSQNVTFMVGGQYMAAAVAGMLASRPTSATLTRKQVAGFLEVSDPRNKEAKNQDAAAGLHVIEQKGSALQVRHSITLDNTSTARRELSVVRSKHRMIESLRQTIDTQIIGMVPANGNAPFIVKNAVVGVLETLRGRGELVDYTGVQARNLVGDPTAVEVRFSYMPAFPLNYVNIVFSIDMTGSTTFEATAV